jgi:hypothetical protein
MRWNSPSAAPRWSSTIWAAARDGTGHSDAALKVVEEIKAAGGEAMSNGGSVTEFEQMVEMVAKAKEAWGGVHILINNAGILRDKSFAKMDMDDFNLVRQGPPDRLGQLHQGGLGHDARAELWPHPHDHLFNRPVTATSAKPIMARPSWASPV